MAGDLEKPGVNHWAVVSYASCFLQAGSPGDYLSYQRAVADQMLGRVFREKLGIVYGRDKIKKGTYGKPYWAGEGDVFFNISNTKGMVACVVSDVEVGIDTEKIKEARISVLRRCCAPEEISYILKESRDALIQERFFQIWTLKESYIKMIGEGLHFPLKQAVFSIGEEGAPYPKVSCSQPGMFCQRKVGGYWISLCAQKEVEVTWQEPVRFPSIDG